MNRKAVSPLSIITTQFTQSALWKAEWGILTIKEFHKQNVSKTVGGLA